MRFYLSNELTRKFVFVAAGFVTILALGVLGYQMIEGWSFQQSLYMTVITVSTVGFREMGEMSRGGEILTMVIIVLGMLLATVLLGTITSFIVEGEIHDYFRSRRMQKAAGSIRDHYVLCGGGQTGAAIAEEFIHHGVPLVVIESDEERVKHLLDRYGSVPVIRGAATDDDNLIQANIGQARGLIAALPADTDNVFVVLSARHINPNLKIIARANLEESREKLYHAGADEVICLTAAGGRRMAAIVLRPLASNFLSMLGSGRDGTPNVYGKHIGEDSHLIGETVRGAQSEFGAGYSILAIQRGESTAASDFIYNPDPDAVLVAGMTLIIFCEPSADVKAFQNV